MIQRILRGLEITILLFILAAMTGYSNPSLTNPIEKVRAYTRSLEFDYVEWIANAAIIKLRTASLNLPYTLDSSEQKRIVMEYFAITQSILEKENELSRLYADASITDKEKATEAVREELEKLYERQNKIAPLAEAILQDQISQVLAEIHLTAAGQPIPNVWYHSTPLPMAMIVSPRDHIEQTANISVDTDLTVDDQVKLEDDITQGLNVSTLIVQIGGIGVYPTMVMRTDYFSWQVSTVVHEWTHNFLSARPLGMLYGETPELRIMNETTASIVENELGPLVIQRFYPQLASPADLWRAAASPASFYGTPPREDPPPIDFRAEMHTTRVRADELLAEGKIEEAETYMEERRQFFWKNGYAIRKLNQAFFSFYGAYADVPGGPAGEDPVGPAVRALRAQSASLTDFLNRISWMRSFDELLAAINQAPAAQTNSNP